MSNINSINKFKSFKRNSETLLCLGPMSFNSFTAICNSSKNSKYPLTVIASRNQIESSDLGGGYVNNWSSESFSTYASDCKANIILARDHGGPYQSSLSYSSFNDDNDSLNDALKSLKNDIDHGFEFIHLDPSKYTKSQITLDGMISSLIEMYGVCDEYSKSQGKNIYYEIGGEGHGSTVGSLEELEYFLQNTTSQIKKFNFKIPTFCVAMLGSLVKETRNIGDFTQNIENENIVDIKNIINKIHSFDLSVKQHNADYLGMNIFKKIPSLGLDAINIAPELGMIETSSLLNILKESKCFDLYNEFNQLAFESNKWKKWVVDSSNFAPEDYTKICGHYLFSSNEFKVLKNQIYKVIPSLDQLLSSELEVYINELLKCLNIYKKF